jgi:hypothetical protein
MKQNVSAKETGSANSDLYNWPKIFSNGDYLNAN